MQEFNDGIKWQFTIDGVKQDKVYYLYFRIQTNCAVYRVIQKLFMFATFPIVLVHFLMNLAQQ